MRFSKKLEMTMNITEGRIRSNRNSLHSDCKNVQKPALKSVNVQRTGKSILQMFAFSFFDGSHILSERNKEGTDSSSVSSLFSYIFPLTSYIIPLTS